MIEGEYQGFRVEIEEPGIAVVTFLQPDRLNAMSVGTRRDMSEVLAEAQLDDDVRVIVLTATGRGFVAGVTTHRGRPAAALPTLGPTIPSARRVPANLYSRLIFHGQDVPRMIRRVDKLIISAVNGFAIQLGLSIALASDFAIAARSAKFG